MSPNTQYIHHEEQQQEWDHILVDVMQPDFSPEQKSSEDGDVEFSKIESSHMKTIQEEDSLES